MGADVWNLSPVWKPSKLSTPEGGGQEEAGPDRWGSRTSFLASPCTGFHGIQVLATGTEPQSGTDPELPTDGKAEEMRDLAELAIGELKQSTPLASPLPPLSPMRVASAYEAGSKIRP